jgi:soluble lytic murein transglycosylase
MQLLPTTAREVAATTGAPAPDQEALSDPRTNIGLGATLLARLLDRHDGAVFKALAGYNAGDDAVAKWEHRYGSRPSDEFVELISYRETRHYVKAVLGNYRAYRQLYAPSPSATSAGSPPKAPLDMMTMTSPGLAEPTR